MTTDPIPDREADDERAPTLTWIRPVYFGTPVPPFAADKPLPSHIVLGSTDATRVETPRKL